MIVLNSGQAEALKWVAFAAMVLDHIDAILLGRTLTVLSLIGRLALPFFALLLVHNRWRFGRSSTRQVARIVGVAVIAQPVSFWVFGVWQLNILFTLAAGLAFVAAWRERGPGGQGILQACVVSAGALAVSLFCEYGPFAILAIGALDCWVRSGRALWAVIAAALLVVANGLLGIAFLGIPAAFLSVIWLRSQSMAVRRMPGWIFYSLYPGHLILLGLFRLLI